jgi:predicted Zn-dependent peptidase
MMKPLSIETHRLANGLTVVLAPDRDVPVVALNLWYGVGSRNERPGRTGFAHLFEHMMFQGSLHVPKNVHFEQVERAGGSLNATTWFDRTNYFETLPSHHLELALWLESDRMGFFLEALTPETLANQQGVVLNERKERYENQPYGDWDERMLRMLWPPEHPYHHTVIGEAADIAAATVDDVADFFRTYYVPNNAVLTLAGDLDTGQALTAVDRWFGPIPAGAPIPPIPGVEDPGPLLGQARAETVESDVPLPRVYLGARIPPYRDPAFHVADLATSILGDGRASRLYRRLIRERRIARDAVSFAFPLVHGRTMMTSWITGFPDSDPEVLTDALIGEVEGLQDVTPREVERVQALAETRLLHQMASLANRADLLSMHQLLFGDASRVNTERDRIRAVTADQIRSFAAQTLVPENRALLTYLPKGAS